MPEKHATLSASGAHRWLNCPPSALKEALLPDTTSEAAKEGTAAHALAEWKLLRWLKRKPGRKPKSDYDSPDLEAYTDDYLQFVKTQVKTLTQKGTKPYVGVEQKLDFSNTVPDGFGTGDCVIISEPVMQIIDLKYGRGVQVFAHDNPQMRLYALGALNAFSLLYEIETVRMSIYQPRLNHIDTVEATVEELNHWANTYVAPIAKIAAVGEGEYKPGDWCLFCKLKGTCRARAEENLAIAQAEFAKPPAQLTPEELAQALQAIPELKAWCKAVEDHTLTTALQGAHYPGYKLVEGRSVRKISDEPKAALLLQQAGIEDIWVNKLKGITELEKQARKTKQNLNSLLGDLLIKPAGKPALVTVDDKRPEIQAIRPADEFTTIEN